jgi:ubiquinone/menaquinone biosynthesis C-methylase UbiE
MARKPLNIRSPHFEEHKITLPAETAQLQTPFSGNIGSAGGDNYPIERNIILLLHGKLPETTLAQDSNFIPLTAASYEDIWRIRSINILSGQNFTIEEETARLTEWLQPQEGQIILDLGASTAIYARALYRNCPESTIIAIDLAPPMLRKAREKCLEEGAELYLMQANAENLPFFASSIDAIACGGSLNEFRDPVKALYEARRVLKKGGRFFLMYLLKADTIAGSLLQRASALGGISFWSADESRQLFERTGFAVRREEQLGIVQFMLLEAV